MIAHMSLETICHLQYLLESYLFPLCGPWHIFVIYNTHSPLSMTILSKCMNAMPFIDNLHIHIQMEYETYVFVKQILGMEMSSYSWPTNLKLNIGPKIDLMHYNHSQYCIIILGTWCHTLQSVWIHIQFIFHLHLIKFEVYPT